MRTEVRRPPHGQLPAAVIAAGAKIGVLRATHPPAPAKDNDLHFQ